MKPVAFPIVGIGASAGGLEAFHSFFDNMPADCGMAFVMILHLPADRKSMLPEILGRWTPMRVLEGHDGALIEPNCVYVPPPHAIVTVQGGRLGVRSDVPDDPKIPRPIDVFFDSLGSALREQAIGIVLSGTGSDGSLGLKAIKECGGLTIAQGSDGSTPQYGEMPAGAIATGSVDLVAPIEDIPGHLLRIKGISPTVFDSTDDSTLAVDAARLKICAILRAQVGHDFSGYRDRTFLRRVQRRMQVVSAATLNDYIARLQADHDEVVLLFRDLLIRVTSFFRDKDTFAALEAQVIPRLFSGKHADSAVRVWVPGCATGEEAYSLAMLLRERMDQLTGVPKVQVFATDIDEAAITTARLGRYPETLLKGLSAERFERFFRASQGSFVVVKEIRDLCTFSEHNLVRDPPFSRMDLVSCRNLLIYMEANLQAAVMPAFHYSLLPGGILLLGGAESTAQHEDLFEPLDKAARIFKRRPGKSPPLNLKMPNADMALQRSVLEASRLPAIEENHPSTWGRGKLSKTDGPFAADKSAHAHPGGGDLKKPLPSRASGKQKRKSGDERLKQELLATQEQLQSLTEQHQTALEELRSANEELHSVNEEMQSTNEELETSKEELQSVNEELQTVNVQLADKVGELAESNSDLRNLFDSTEIATIFLDRQLIIRSFTPAIASLYSLIPSDAGRPLINIVSCLDYDRLGEDVDLVLKTLKPLERRIARKDRSMHYIMRILPYREPDSTVSGVLVTFVDVTSIVQAEAALREADLRKDVFLATLSHELRNPLAPIRTAARLLEAPNVAPPQLERAQTIITRQVAHMSSLLDDLLDVSRITRGAFALKRERVEVKKLLDAAVESAQPALDAKHHTLRVEVPEAPVMLQADPVRLTQVLTNLLSNAAKYTPAGGLITVGSRLEAQELILFVRDNGIGITAAMIPQIFDMFTQVESPEGVSEGGLGIGLALVKGLVQLHGGRITANSAGLGKGSEFAVSLPRYLVIEAPPSTADAFNGHADSNPPRRILIADDNRDSAESLGMLLNLSGHEVFLAHSGTEALNVAKEQRPDVAVLDIGMPDLSGYEVAQRIRLETWGQQITLIALTGWGQESDKRRAQAAGFDHHCTKPVDPDDLQRFFAPDA
jgi:two-component system, chemotaxis family, CheB/CheR fusion protein